MKVTKHGNTHEEWTPPIATACPGCGCQIEEIAESDIMQFGTTKFIKCPECDRNIQLL